MLPGRSILIFHLGALGDFIITWPLALTLARVYPQSRIFYVTHAEKGALAEKALRLESIDVESGWHHLFSEPASLPEPAAKRLAGAHTVVSFIAGEDEPWSKNVRAVASNATLMNPSTKIPADFEGHVAEYVIEQLSPWTAAHTAGIQILKSIASRGVGPERKPGDTVVLHPGAGSAKKLWPAAAFSALAGRLAKRGAKVRVLLGEVELESWKPDDVSQLRQTCDVVQPKNLLDLHAQLADAKAFVGNDSGPGHLAGILGIPTLSLFGPASNAKHWRPLGPRTDVVFADSLETLSADEVYDRLLRLAGEIP